MSNSLVIDLAKGLSWHAVRLATFRGSPKDMPESTGLLILLMALSVMGGIAEQMARNHGLTMALSMPVLWMFFVVTYSWNDGTLDKRMASALFLVSLPIDAAMALTGFLPSLEWPVAVWGGIAMIALVSRREQGL